LCEPRGPSLAKWAISGLKLSKKSKTSAGISTIANNSRPLLPRDSGVRGVAIAFIVYFLTSTTSQYHAKVLRPWRHYPAVRFERQIVSLGNGRVKKPTNR